jgi:hypothetical protein
MAKKASSSALPSTPIPPEIYEAILGNDGAVIKGAKITQTKAEASRKAGKDVVVCGPNLSANRGLAQTVEKNANGRYKRCPPHPNAGSLALPHYQPDPRPPDGHTFYETPNRKAQ